MDERQPVLQSIINPLWEIISGGSATSKSTFIASEGAKIEVIVDAESV